MKIVTLLGATIVGATLTIMPAHAAILTESFTFTGAVYSVAGQFTYDQSNGQLQSITGNVVTGALIEGITALVTGASPFFPVPGNSNGFTFDNTFDSVSGTFPLNGVLFSFGSGNYGSFYYNPEAFFSTWLPDGPTSPSDCSVGDLYCPGDAGTLKFTAVSPVPELSSWAMMLLGFLGMGFLGRAVREVHRGLAAPR
ncbi:hypothetical protein [Bradyrhizobium sp. AZCC 2230]|uniref:hypothetical protein n=1 Tax=Bradyrhizobium sp. AZCC 2230 TaxID=3117021 RepID=UPI002FF3AC04